MESKSRVFLDDWRCSHAAMARLLVNGFPPNRKKAASETFERPRYPNWDGNPENPRVDPRVYAELPVSEKAGGMQRSCMKFSQVTWCARRKRSGLGGFRRFLGLLKGRGCIRFAGLGKKFHVISHQQSLFVGRKLKDGSFNTRQRWLFLKTSGHSPRVAMETMGRNICYFFSFVLLELKTWVSRSSV